MQLQEAIQGTPARYLLPTALTVALMLVTAPAPVSSQRGHLIRVPQDYPAINKAISAAQPGDLILLDRGTYPGGVVIPKDKPNITLRGVDRNAVLFDGEDVRASAIDVEADDVSLENMSAHNFVGNGFYWEGVEGFVGRYLTVWNVGLYGIYAIESRDGIFEHSLVSGAADAAFYIGECNPCDTVLSDLIARLSAVGFSGTNAGGNLAVKDSLWENNGAGILPNSFDVGKQPPPQRGAVFVGNTVRGSGSVPTPVNTPLGGFVGIGIGVQGGNDNFIQDNEVTGSTRFGIAIFPAIDRATVWVPEGNEVIGNRVHESGVADLALSAGSGKGNCFVGNQFQTALPEDISQLDCILEGSALVAQELAVPPPTALQRLEDLDSAPSYTSIDPPRPQPAMPGATDDLPDPRSSAVANGRAAPMVLLAATAIAVLLALLVVLVRRRSRGSPQ